MAYKTFVCPRNSAQLDGYAMLIVQQRRTNTLHLGSICIDKTARRKGIGKMLMLKCIEAATEAGFHSLELFVDPENSSAISMYETLNFDVLENLPDVYGKNSARLRMRKELVVGEVS